MQAPRDINSYGGKFVDELPVQNPTTEQSAAYANRLHDDTAQMSRTSDKFTVKFLSVTSAQTVVAANVSVQSHYGIGSAHKPTVVRTASIGVYTLTFATSYLDGLDQSDSFSLFSARGFVMSTTQVGHVQCTIAGNVVTTAIFDMAGVATDLTAGTTICIEGK